MAVAAVAKVVAVDDLKQPATMPQVTLDSNTAYLMDLDQLTVEISISCTAGRSYELFLQSLPLQRTR
jgi:hypothetical protein